MSLPAVILEIIAVIGHGKTMALVDAFGGQELRIPKTDASDTWHALAEVIGEAAIRKLSAAFGGGEPLYIAKCLKAVNQDRNRRMIARYDALLKEGHSSRGAVSVLVRENSLCYRWVEKIINAPLPAPSVVAEQGQLF